MPTKIEWADESWNPVTGCTKVDEGCRNCYAERMSKRLAGRYGYPADDPFRVTLHPERLDKPLHWKKPRRIFVNSMSDLFHPDVPDAFIDQVFAVMALASHHQFMILTKRPKNMMHYLEWEDYDPYETRVDMVNCRTSDFAHTFDEYITPEGWPLPNVWLGVSVHDQKSADERIPILLQTPAAKRFVSYEPALGAVDFTYLENGRSCGLTGWYITPDKTGGGEPDQHQGEKLDLVIMGGESGHGARPTHPDWARTVRDDCAAAGVPFLFKQWG
ncbi:hypothetical protein LCGC14_2313330, partial [marine sediment metagenome]